MAFFSRRQSRKARSAFNTGHALDDKLLGILDERSDLSSPRHWLHFLYFPDEDCARTWAASIEATGWTIQYVAPAATDDGQWIVVPERHDFVVSAEAVRSARVYFESVTAQVKNAEYDGWEASL
jgi:hypothetical protein